jgi:hypothetical protein
VSTRTVQFRQSARHKETIRILLQPPVTVFAEIKNPLDGRERMLDY